MTQKLRCECCLWVCSPYTTLLLQPKRPHASCPCATQRPSNGSFWHPFDRTTDTTTNLLFSSWKVISLRVLVNFLVLGLLVFSAYIVFIVVERSTQPEADDTWWRQNEITISLSIISIVFPIFFELLGLLEGYHPRKCLRIQLARIMVLNMLNLYTLIFSQFWKISKMVSPETLLL